MPLSLEATLAAAEFGMSLQDFWELPGTREHLFDQNTGLPVEDAKIPLSQSCLIAQYRLKHGSESTQQDIALRER